MTEAAEQKEDLGAPPPRWVLKLFTRINVIVYKLSGGKLMNKLGGDEIFLVTMTGAKSGKKRTIPLMYVQDGDNFLLVASQGGAPKNPVWYNNLVAHPDISITYAGKTYPVRARLAEPQEKEALWPVCDAHYAEYATYRKRTDRDIPMFICEPR